MKLTKVVSVIMGCALVMGITVSAVDITPRAWPDFNAELPANSKGKVVSTSKKLFTDDKISVTVNCDDSALETVEAWTQSSVLGINNSDKHEVYVNAGRKDFSYTNKPSVQTQVSLKMDNVDKVDKTFTVSGEWSPW